MAREPFKDFNLKKPLHIFLELSNTPATSNESEATTTDNDVSGFFSYYILTSLESYEYTYKVTVFILYLVFLFSRLIFAFIL